MSRAQLAASSHCTHVCRVAIPIEKFFQKPEQDIEDWYELGKNDFASDIGTVSSQSCWSLLLIASVPCFFASAMLVTVTCSASSATR